MTELTLEERVRLDDKKQRLSKLERAVGRKHFRCTLDNYKCDTPEQATLIERARRYSIDKIDQVVSEGKSMVLLGHIGTGKDHIAIGIAKNFIEAGKNAMFVNCQTLFAEFRKGISEDRSDSEVMSQYTRPDLLILSDPIHRNGQKPIQLTDYQSLLLYRIIDARYCRVAPTILTVNCEDRNVLNDFIGAKIIDRLLDNGMSYGCFWPSYRTKDVSFNS